MTTVPSRRSSRLGLGVAFIAGVIAFAAVFKIVAGLQGGRQGGLIAAAERTEAKLTMPTLDGGLWKLGEREGKVVVVNYFATWCGPCRGEMPALFKIAGAYGPRGVEMALLSVDTDDNNDGRPYMEALRAFREQEKVELPILVPPRDSGLFREVDVVPQTFLIDKHGRTAKRVVGAVDEKELRGWLEELLKEP